MLRLALAALHLLALGIGLGGVWGRARALGERPLDGRVARRAFEADSWWGVAAMVWIATGLWRLLTGTEKATSYYLHNDAFLTKMAILVVILLLEIWPMATLLRWRTAARRSGRSWSPNERTAGRIAAISYVQVVLVIGMVVAAVMMARGYGYRGQGG